MTHPPKTHANQAFQLGTKGTKGPMYESETFQSERRRIQEEANRKRAEAMQGVAYAPKGEPRKAEKVRDQTVHIPSHQSQQPERKAKAAAANVNLGAVLDLFSPARLTRMPQNRRFLLTGSWAYAYPVSVKIRNREGHPSMAISISGHICFAPVVWSTREDSGVVVTLDNTTGFFYTFAGGFIMRTVKITTDLSTAAFWRLGKLAEAWDCSINTVLERITREAASTYNADIFKPIGVYLIGGEVQS